LSCFRSRCLCAATLIPFASALVSFFSCAKPVNINPDSAKLNINLFIVLLSFISSTLTLLRAAFSTYLSIRVLTTIESLMRHLLNNVKRALLRHSAQADGQGIGNTHCTAVLYTGFPFFCRLQQIYCFLSSSKVHVPFDGNISQRPIPFDHKRNFNDPR